MPLSLGAVITITWYYQSPYNRRSNTHLHDSSREENSGNVRAAVRQRLYPIFGHMLSTSVLMSVRQ